MNETRRKKEKETGFLNTRNTQEEKKRQKKKKSSKKTTRVEENQSKINKQPPINQSTFLNTSMHFDHNSKYDLDQLLRKEQQDNSQMANEGKNCLFLLDFIM